MIFYELSRKIRCFINELFEPFIVLDENTLAITFDSLDISNKESLLLLLNAKAPVVLSHNDEEILLNLEHTIRKTLQEQKAKSLPGALNQIIKKSRSLRTPHRRTLFSTLEESAELENTLKNRLKEIYQKAIFKEDNFPIQHEKVTVLSQRYSNFFILEEYQKLLIYCSFAREFENKGVPEEHAVKLCILFGHAKKAIEALDNYAKQSMSGFNGRRQNREADYVYQACLFSLPNTAPNDWLKWRSLFQDVSNFSDVTFRKMLCYSQEIADFYSQDEFIQIDNEEVVSQCKRTLHEHRNELLILRSELHKIKAHPMQNAMDAEQRNSQLALKNKQLNLLLQSYAIICKKERTPFLALDKDAVHGIYNRFLTIFSRSYSFLVQQGLNQTLINKFLSLDRSQAGREIPELYIEHDKYPGYYLRKLEVKHHDLDAAKAACLGHLSDSCQSIGNVGNDCAIHGLTSPWGGFYVLCRKIDIKELFFEEEIIAQSWVWRSKDGGIVFDSIEYQSGVSEDILEFFYNQASIQLTLDGITRVYVGDTDKTPKQIGIPIGLKGQFIDYSGYNDSTIQKVLRHEDFPYLKILWDKEDNFGRNQTTKKLKEQLVKPLDLLARNRFMRYFIQDVLKKHSRLSIERLSKYCSFSHFDETEKKKLMQFILINKTFYNLLEAKTPNINEVLHLFMSGAVIKSLTNGSGDTVLHLIENKKNLELLWHEYYSLEDRFKVLMQKNNMGETFWHSLALDNEEVIRIFFESFPEEDWCFLLSNHEEYEGLLAYLINKIPSRFEFTFKLIPQKYQLSASISLMQLLCCEEELLKITLNLLLEQNSINSVFEAIDKFGNTFLHYMAYSQPELLKECFDLFKSEPPLKTLARITQQNFEKNSVLYQATYNPESFMFLSSFFSEPMLLKEMKKRNSEGNTIMHSIATRPNLLQPLLEPFFKTIPVSEIIQLFKAKNNLGDNVLHSAFFNSNAFDIALDFFLKYVASEKDLQIVKERNNDGDMVLHCFDNGSFKKILQILFKYLKPQEVLALLKEKDGAGVSTLAGRITDLCEFEEILTLLVSKIDLELIVDFMTEKNEKSGAVIEEIFDLKLDKAQLFKICYRLLPSLYHELSFLKIDKKVPPLVGFFSEASEVIEEESPLRIAL